MRSASLSEHWLWLCIGQLVLLSLTGCGPGNGIGLDISGRPADGAGSGPLTATFSSIQANVFTTSCATAGCHSGSAAPLGLRLDAASSYALLVNVSSVEESGILRVAPGDPDNSYLIQKIEGTAGTGARMPLGLPPLPQSTVDVIREWISAGANPDPGPAGPPVVVTVVPDADAVVTALPTTIEVIFSAALDAALIGDTTVQLIRAGGDGGFSEGNEIIIAAASITLATDNAAILDIDLTGVASVDDDYQLTLIGSGATAIAGTDGQLLDGDGDGAAGGDYVTHFVVLSILPTLESIQAIVFTPSCATAGCHTGPVGPNLPAGLDLSSDGASFSNLVDVASSEVPSLDRVKRGDADNSYLIQKLNGIAAVGAQMPLGGQPLPSASIDVIGQWINDGAPFDGEPADISAPTVSLNQPISPLVGTVTISAVAADNVGVTQVEFFVDGVSIGTKADEPYSINWDTTTLANGSYDLQAQAADEAGNVGQSEIIVVVVDNTPPDTTPPSVMLTAPVATDVSGLVTIAADANDDVEVAEVQFFVDGLLLGIDMMAPYAVDWDTALFSDDDHVLSATAIDTSGNSADSATLAVTVDNGPSDDVTPPTVMLTAPAAGVVTGTVMIAADASDDFAVTEVRFFAGIDFLGADASAPYGVDWNTTLFTDGDVTLTAEAGDAAGNTGFSGPVNVTIDNTAPQVVTIDPTDAASLDSLPAEIAVTFSETMAGATIDTTSFVLETSGGDGTFGDGNESIVTPDDVSTPTPDSAVMDLTGVASADDTYRITLQDTITDASGLALDGDGDTQAGGVFTSTFTVSSAPTYTVDVQPILMAKCAPCHTSLGVGGHNIGSDYNSASQNANTCAGLNVAECSLVRIQNGSMPQSAGCTGDPVQDAGNANCLTQEEQDTVEAWIDAGLPE